MSSIVKQFTYNLLQEFDTSAIAADVGTTGSQLGKQAASSLRDQFPDSRRRSYQGGEFWGF